MGLRTDQSVETVSGPTPRSWTVPWMTMAWGVIVAFLCLSLADVGNSAYLISVIAWALAMVTVTLRVRVSASVGRHNATAVWLSPLIAWALLVLVPWSVNLSLDRPWPVGLEGFVDNGLPATYALNLAALAGLTLGLLCVSRPITTAAQVTGRPRQWRVAAVGLSFVAIYFGSLVASTSSVVSFWRLGSENAYLQTTAARGSVGYFDLIPTTMVVFVLCLVFLEKQSTRRLSLPTWGLLAITTVIAFGLGSRFRLGLLIFGLLAIFWTSIDSRAIGRRITLMVGGVVGAAGFVLVSGFLSFYRAGLSGNGLDDILDRFARGIDVLGMQEMAVQRGMAAGSLAGQSYRELPAQALPRALTESDKLAPVAQRELGLYLDERAGFSAPAWFEPWLNFGLVGVLVWGVLFTIGFRLLLGAIASSRRAATLCLFAPLWTLTIYQIFSRLLTTLALSTILASLVALLLARWVVQPVKSSMAVTEQTHDDRNQPVTRLCV